MLEPQTDFTAAQVRKLKEFYEDFFDAPPRASDAKALGKESGTALREMIGQLKPLVAQAEQYPFLNALAPEVEKLEAIAGKPHTWYLTELFPQKDELLERKEQLIDPIRKFMSGPQKEIYQQAKSFMQNQEENFTYINGNEAGEVQALLDDPSCYKGSRMQNVKTLIDTLKVEVAGQIATEREKAVAAVSSFREKLQGTDEFAALAPDEQEQIKTSFEGFAVTVGQKSLIAVIRDALRNFEADEYPGLLSQMAAQSRTARKSNMPQGGAISGEDNGVEASRVERVEEARVQYISSRSIQVNFDKAWLADESDVDRYLKLVREALLDAIGKGKRIQT